MIKNTIFNENLNILFWDEKAETQKEFQFTEIKVGLEQVGWTALIHTDINKAKEEALKNHIHAVVLDLNKEDGSPAGQEALTFLRSKKPFLPIIMFASYLEIESIHSAHKDASYYLKAPIKTYHDVIHAIEIAFEREKAKERLIQDRYLTSLGKISEGVAHFIKNSLWNIRSRAQYLLKKTDNKDESHELLKTITSRCDDANQVVVNLLKFASRKQETEGKERVSIANIVENVLKLVTFELKNLDIKYHLNVLSKQNWIEGNEFQLREAFLNIIKNSIEAMPGGGELTVSINSDKKNIGVVIADTGIGMSKEVLDNLFMPYFSTKETSVGFGLFDTQRIINLHNGSIKAESKPGEWSRIICSFPIHANQKTQNKE